MGLCPSRAGVRKRPCLEAGTPCSDSDYASRATRPRSLCPPSSTPLPITCSCTPGSAKAQLAVATQGVARCENVLARACTPVVVPKLVPPASISSFRRGQFLRRTRTMPMAHLLLAGACLTPRGARQRRVLSVHTNTTALRARPLRPPHESCHSISRGKPLCLPQTSQLYTQQGPCQRAKEGSAFPWRRA